MKKLWQKPKLIILERGRPEEMVLVTCKVGVLRTTSNNKKGGCCITSAQCPPCETISAS
jgi:hypothetical protein